MSIGIYSITNKIDGKRYIGKSINIEARFWTHRNHLKKDIRNKDCNRHLFNAVKKYGMINFDFEIVWELAVTNEPLLAELELFYIDSYDTTNREYGYNLRRDSSTKCYTHPETRNLKRICSLGAKNPNFGNTWSDEQKATMSRIAKERHKMADSVYNDDWKNKISSSSGTMWKDMDKRKLMGERVKIAKRLYIFIQCDENNNSIAFYDSVEAIVLANPGFKWQKIYQACSGYIKRYKGYVWIKVSKC